MKKDFVFGHKRQAFKKGITIQFIGHNGKIFKEVHTMRAEFNMVNVGPYVRAKVIFQEGEKKKSAYYAWTQPFFLDERLD